MGEQLMSLSAQSSSLFNQVLSAWLVQPIGGSSSDFKTYRTKVTLKIAEQRNENSGEKEIRIEVSRPDDYEFLFAECLNHDKYQAIARGCKSTVDFDAFPRTLIDKMLSRLPGLTSSESVDAAANRNKAPKSFADGTSTEINLILDAERSNCTFELSSKTPVGEGRIFAIKLNAVRGEQLISHVANKLRKISKQYIDMKKNFEQQRDELERLQKENDENSEKVKSLKLELAEKTDELEETLDKYEIEKDERERVVELTDTLKAEIADLNEKLDQRAADYEEKDEECVTLQAELEEVVSMLREEQSLSKSFRKQKDEAEKERDRCHQFINKYVKNSPSQSIDMQKLMELKADLKEKEDIIAKLTEKNSSIKAELDEKCELLRKANEQAQQDTRKLEFYRTQRFSPGVGPIRTGNSPYTPVLGVSNPGATQFTPVLGMGASPYAPRIGFGSGATNFHSPYDQLARPLTPSQMHMSTYDGTALRNLTNTDTLTTTPKSAQLSSIVPPTVPNK